MITRWETIAERTAERLKLPVEQVKEIILDMAKKTAAHASHPTVMETDLLGIGVLKTRMGKLQARLIALPRIIGNRKRLVKKYTEFGNTTKVEQLLNDIKLMEKDILVFTEILALKQDIYEVYGRNNYMTNLLGSPQAKDVVPVKKKIILSDVEFKRPGRRKGWRKKRDSEDTGSDTE
jgi:hypothetical protein